MDACAGRRAVRRGRALPGLVRAAPAAPCGAYATATGRNGEAGHATRLSSTARAVRGPRHTLALHRI
ncbi:protein of unknown function [Paraburkholderia kururiensis]